MDETHDQTVRHLEGILGVLDQRLGEIGDVDLGGLQGIAAQSHLAKRTEEEHHEADDYDETGRKVDGLTEAKAESHGPQPLSWIRRKAISDGIALESAARSIENSRMTGVEGPVRE